TGSAVWAKIDGLLKTVGLYADRDKPLSQYSKGMLQRIGIAQALVNDPKLLFLDEPTSGLDPIAHSEIRDLILDLRKQGKTVFLSSHQLSDVEMVCDRVSILHRGNLLKVGRLDEMLARGHVEIMATGVPAAVAEELADTATCRTGGEGCLIISHSEGEEMNAAIDKIRAAGGRIISVIPQKHSLEELFVEMIREVNK
ncbi:MAG: ATP-binding cassette domain-containing protein, partial [Armatimonadota bacterium]